MQLDEKKVRFWELVLEVASAGRRGDATLSLELRWKRNTLFLEIIEEERAKKWN